MLRFMEVGRDIVAPWPMDRTWHAEWCLAGSGLNTRMPFLVRSVLMILTLPFRSDGLHSTPCCVPSGSAQLTLSLADLFRPNFYRCKSMGVGCGSWIHMLLLGSHPSTRFGLFGHILAFCTSLESSEFSLFSWEQVLGADFPNSIFSLEPHFGVDLFLRSPSLE